MKKKIYTIILSLVSIVSMYAQSVGINTLQPQGIFHIDSKKNTSGLNNTTDDIIIDNTGRLGIGEIAPQEKVDINGTFQLKDGTQGAGKALVSDNTGRAYWTNFIINPRTVWTLNSPAAGYTLNNTAQVVLPGTGSFSINDIPGITTTSNYVNIPPGKYMIMIHGGIDTRLEGGVRIPVTAYNSIALRYHGTTEALYTIFVSRANGSSFIYNTSINRSIDIALATRSLEQHIGVYKNPPHTSATYAISVTFIKL